MRQHKLWLCTLLVLLLAALGAFGAAAETTVGMSGAGSFKMEQVYVNVPELDVYFYALDGDGNSYSPIKVQAAGPELTLGDRRLEVRSVAAASDPICYILALDNSKNIAPSEFYTMLGGVRKLINAMGDDDQLMLYTTAGSTECVLPATSDKNLMYKTLGSIKQVEGSMDTARLISAVYSELQSDYQALAPRKAAMIVTDAGQVLTNMTLFATLASDVSNQIGMAAYIYLMTDRPGAFETLESAADGRLVLCEASTLGDELKKKQEYLATALEIKTEVPESLYGERLETLTLAMPQLGSAIRSSQTVYMGYRLAKPQVTKVETLRRDKLRLTFNQPINENANKPQLYEVRSKDIWNWRVQVKSVTISEDARAAELEIEPLYKGDYTVALNRVSGKMSAANVSSSRDTATFKVFVWPRDRAFYFARFRVPLLIAAVLLLVEIAQAVILALGFVSIVHVPQNHLLLETDMEIFITVLLTMFSSSCIGLLISALFTSGESAILAVLVLMIGQVVFSNIMFTVTGAAATISNIIVCRWGMGALGASTDLNSRMAWLQAGLDGPMYDATVENLTHSWQMLGLISVVCLVAAWLVLQIAFDKKKA